MNGSIKSVSKRKRSGCGIAALQPNPAWASLALFDRKGWRRMAFGEFAESIGERVEPKDAQEEIYVGLEHLDPQCLHIRRWGQGSDVIGGKLRFRKGDIIFGKRRAYQRKLAVAEFDGICSAHAMVVRARPDKVLPELLPFLMMSDRFMNRAVEISVGSLSPTINWTTLKLETFDLPPLGQQRRIAAILWEVDAALRCAREQGDSIFGYLQAKIASAMQREVLSTSDRNSQGYLGDLFTERRQNGFGDLPILSVTIDGRIVRRESLERNVIDKTGTEKYLRVCPGDIAYNTMRMWQGSCGVVSEEGIISSAYTVLIPVTAKVDGKFWNYAFHTPQLLDAFRRYSTGVAADRWRLYYRNFAKISVREPSLKRQRELVCSFEEIEKAKAQSDKYQKNLAEVLRSLLNYCTQT